MSLTVNPVSRLSFGNGAQPAAPQDVSNTNAAPQGVSEDIFARQGAFASPEEPAAAAANDKPKKHSALKTVAGIVVGLAVVAGALYGLKKGGVVKEVENLADLKGFDKVKKSLEHYLAKGGGYVEQGVNSVADFFKKNWNKLFHKEPKAA